MKHLPIILAPLLLLGCARPLPEAGTSAARLYQQKCGACHAAYDPRSLTPAMWREQLAAMRPKLAAAGILLAPNDEVAILDYLQRNAGRD